MNGPALARAYGALLLSLLLLLWLHQDSLNGYWQNSYHQPSPLEALDELPGWRQGAELRARLEETLAELPKRFQPPPRPRPVRRSTPTPSPTVEPLAALAAELRLTADRRTGIVRHSSSLLQELQDEITAAALAVRPSPEQQRWQEALLEPPPPTPPPVLVQREAEPPAAALPPGGEWALRPDRSVQVLFIGDSFMQGIGPPAQQLLQQRAIGSLNLSKQSTGLVNNKAFNWAERLQAALEQHADLRLLVVFLGPNDPWDIYGGRQHYRFASPEWGEEYRRRMRELIDLATDYGLRVFWVEIPAMRNDRYNAKMNYLNGLIYAEAQASGFVVIPSRRLLSGDQYQEVLQRGNQTLRIRAKDGIHLSAAGYKIIAQEILRQLSPPPH